MGGKVMSDAIRPWPLVKEGDSQHPVQSVPYLLHQRGHAVTIDGIFGPKTDAAVKGFQKGLGVTQDGTVSDTIWQALVSGMLPG
ncbi:MAG TPA: peptidoglycan-binding domain-containing protein [Streptosporangiaceae bacterium]